MKLVKWIVGSTVAIASVEGQLENHAWAVAPFPSNVVGLTGVTCCGYDSMVIPRGAGHRKEAFEFIAYVSRQNVSEKSLLQQKPDEAMAHIQVRLQPQYDRYARVQRARRGAMR